MNIVEIDNVAVSNIKPVLSKRGKKAGQQIGTQVNFGSIGLNIRDAKATYKAQGMSGSAASRKVNELLRSGDEKSLRELQLAAVIQRARELGLQPDFAKFSATGATVKFAKPTKPRASKAEAELEAARAETEKARAELAELKALVASLQA